jgi:hypothetical protein
MTYKLLKNQYTNTISAVQKTLDGVVTTIPFDEANIDYQEYLEWAKTNTAEEAD